MSTGVWVTFVILALVLGLVAGFFISRYMFKKELKKHPPINEKSIRVMFNQMGRKPSEAQIKQIMRAMEEANK